MKIKNLLFATTLLLLSWSPVFSQGDYCTPFSGFSNGGFETVSPNCQNLTWPVNYDCLPPWLAAHGSPSLFQSFGGVTPFEGENMIGLGARLVTNGGCKNESMFVELELDPTKLYELSFHHQVANSSSTIAVSPLDIQIFLTNGLSNVMTGSIGSCSDLEIPSEAELVFSMEGFQNIDWTDSGVIPIEPTPGFNQLLFVVYPKQNIALTNYWLIDDVKLDECDPCIQPVSAEFNLDLESTGPSTFMIEAVDYGLYSDIDGQHEWQVLGSTNVNGPFELLSVIEGDEFVYSGQDGLFYTVYHKVTTDCGEFCYIENICRNCPEGIVVENCEICGPVDCDIITELVPTCNETAPSFTGCQIGLNGELQLIWTPVPYATCYQVYFTDKCCKDPGFLPLYIEVPALEFPLLNIPSSFPSCFSWRVRACCPEGYSPFTPYSCLSPKTLCKTVAGIKSDVGDVSSQLPLENQLPSLKVSPNPSSDVFNISLSFENPEAAVIRILDSSGKLVYTSGEQRFDAGVTLFEWSPEKNLSNGLYFLELKSGSQTIHEKLILNR